MSSLVILGFAGSAICADMSSNGCVAELGTANGSAGLAISAGAERGRFWAMANGSEDCGAEAGDAEDMCTALATEAGLTSHPLLFMVGMAGAGAGSSRLRRSAIICTGGSGLPSGLDEAGDPATAPLPAAMADGATEPVEARTGAEGGAESKPVSGWSLKLSIVGGGMSRSRNC